MFRRSTRKRRILLAVLGAITLSTTIAFLVLGRTNSERVAPNVTVLRTSNGLSNIGANVTIFVSEQSILLVDAQLAPLSRRIRRLVRNIRAAPIAGLVNTHWHPDHTGGNGRLSAGAPIIAHPAVLAHLNAPQEAFGLTKPGSHHSFEAHPARDWPTQLVPDSASIPYGSATVRVMHPGPAHTDGDLIVYDETSRVLVVGDLVWPASYPFVDVHNGGSATGLADALAGLLSWIPSDAVVVPGHGAVMTVQQLATYQAMVLESIAEIRHLFANGLSLEEAMERGLPESFRAWGSELVPASEWIRMVYQGLEQG